jgi:hypothetical protein
MDNLVWLVALACPLMMVAMMWMMGKGMSMGKKSDAEHERSVAELRAEKERLEAEIDSRTTTEDAHTASSRPGHA